MNVRSKRKKRSETEYECTDKEILFNLAYS
jgi:hypothetical protein